MDTRWIVGIPLVALCCTAEGPDSPGAEQGRGAEFVIPMVPWTAASHWLHQPEGPVVGAGGELTYTLASSIDLARGDGYPTAIDLTMQAYPITGEALCGEYVQPEMTFETIEQVEGLDVRALATDQLRVGHTALGRHQVVVGGRYRFEPPTGCPGAPSEAAFVLTLDVAVRRPTGVEVQLPQVCADADAPRLQSGAEFAAGLALALVDDDGEAFVPKNADPVRPVEIRVRGGADHSFSTYDESLATLVASGPPGTVRVEGLGDSVVLELVEPGDIDAMDAAFTLTGATLTDLASGASYGQDGWGGHAFASIQPALFALYSGGEPLCSRPIAESFELASATPEVCSVVEGRAHGSKTVGGFLVPQSADVAADGRCALSLRAPQFAGGDGVAAELSATFVNTAELAGGARE